MAIYYSWLNLSQYHSFVLSLVHAIEIHTCNHSRIEWKNRLQSNAIANFLPPLVLGKQTMIVPTRKTSGKRAAECLFF